MYADPHSSGNTANKFDGNGDYFSLYLYSNFLFTVQINESILRDPTNTIYVFNVVSRICKINQVCFQFPYLHIS